MNRADRLGHLEDHKRDLIAQLGQRGDESVLSQIETVDRERAELGRQRFSNVRNLLKSLEDAGHGTAANHDDCAKCEIVRELKALLP